MPNQTVYEFRSAGVREATVSASSFFATDNVVSIRESPVWNTPSESSESHPDGLGCARGLRTAFLFEAGMVLLAYGVWHYWHHLVR